MNHNLPFCLNPQVSKLQGASFMMQKNSAISIHCLVIKLWRLAVGLAESSLCNHYLVLCLLLTLQTLLNPSLFSVRNVSAINLLYTVSDSTSIGQKQTLSWSCLSSFFATKLPFVPYYFSLSRRRCCCALDTSLCLFSLSISIAITWVSDSGYSYQVAVLSIKFVTAID